MVKQSASPEHLGAPQARAERLFPDVEVGTTQQGSDGRIGGLLTGANMMPIALCIHTWKAKCPIFKAIVAGFTGKVESCLKKYDTWRSRYIYIYTLWIHVFVDVHISRCLEHELYVQKEKKNIYIYIQD